MKFSSHCHMVSGPVRNVSVEIRHPCKIMDVLNETKITLCWELHEQGLPKIQIARRLGKHWETIHLWIKGIERHDLMDFLGRYGQAKKGECQRRQVNPILK